MFVLLPVFSMYPSIQPTAAEEEEEEEEDCTLTRNEIYNEKTNKQKDNSKTH